MPWIYDPNAGGSGYVDTETGEVLSDAEAQALIDGMIGASENVADTLAQMYADGLISPADWREEMREEIEDEYIVGYLAGIGGLLIMEAIDWEALGAMIAEQFGYLDAFTEDLSDLTPEQIAARARMYMRSSREAYETARRKAADRFGYTEYKWVLGIAEHCEDCVTLSNLGYISITIPFISPSSGEEAIPGNGATRCHTNCQCHLEYR